MEYEEDKTRRTELLDLIKNNMTTYVKMRDNGDMLERIKFIIETYDPSRVQEVYFKDYLVHPDDYCFVALTFISILLDIQLTRNNDFLLYEIENIVLSNNLKESIKLDMVKLWLQNLV